MEKKFFYVNNLQLKSSLPPSGDLWGLFVNIEDKRMDLWVKLMPTFEYDPDVPFFEILVPTIDTVRMG